MSASNTPIPGGRMTPTTPAGRLQRPRIKIQIPPHNQSGNFAYFNAASPYPMSTTSNPSMYANNAPQWPASPQYAPKSMMKQIEGFKDITWDWTKTGLNHGEKSVWYLYERISRWSRRWFTHIFLMTIVFLYSVAGAYIFIAIEGRGD